MRAKLKARDELREDEIRKLQSLVQFKEWLHKHPFLINSRDGEIFVIKDLHNNPIFRVPDDNFLLAFLRTKKYSMEQAFKVYENHFMFRHSHPETFEIRESKEERFKSLFLSGFGYPALERDSEGRKIFIINHSRFDTEKHSTDDVFYLIYGIIATLLEDEETQICGLQAIFNYNGATLKYLAAFSMKQHVDLVNFVAHASPGRISGVYLVNMPSFANQVLNVAKLAMSEKMKRRLHLVPSLEELSNYINVGLLPLEFGGKVPEAEMIKISMKAYEDNLENLRNTNSFKIDMEKAAPAKEASNSAGSFRRLEID